GHGELRRRVAVLRGVERLAMERDEVHARPDLSLLELLDEARPIDRQPVEPQTDRVEMPGVADAGSRDQGLDSVQAREARVVPGGDPGTARLHFMQPPELHSA